MDIARLVLDYLRAVLSPQMIAGAVAMAVLVLFKNDMRRLLPRIAKVRLPGGSELAFQAERNRREDARPNPPSQALPLPQNATPDQVSNTIAAYQAEARIWEFRYLGYFLARDTQWTLDWIASATGATIQVLDLVYAPLERDAILDALQKHRLIEQADTALLVTEKGRHYIAFRGPLPPSLPADA